NSDVYCPFGWETKLLKALASFDIVGPSSGRVCGRQQIEEAEKHKKDWTAEDVEAFSIRNANKFGMTMECIKTVGGFCFLLKKKVIDRIGYFDERFGLGSYEETDYCVRARKVGFICGWVKGCYVHHYGHASFCRVNNSKALWEKNRELFKKIHKMSEGDVISLYE
ncbi:MAG: glycosyltransferase family 2 protein, partial [Nitrospirae bacterium]|nr:glycosyltransferase family 2 protein [Nitrospirota bacterium]